MENTITPLTGVEPAAGAAMSARVTQGISQPTGSNADHDWTTHALINTTTTTWATVSLPATPLAITFPFYDFFFSSASVWQYVGFIVCGGGDYCYMKGKANM